MRVLDLFAGIGGFSLAAHWMGWETVGFVEIDPFCQKVLAKNFPNVPIHGDIKQFDGTAYTETVDIICGGFPCQPFSHAGQRKGKEDDRYLWDEMLRVIREVQPAWVIGENVAGILSMDNGDTIESIQADLESEGYAVQSFVIPACAVGAPHRRDRIWIVANANFGNGRRNARIVQKSNGQSGIQKRKSVQFVSQSDSIFNPDSCESGLQRSQQPRAFEQGTRTPQSTAEFYQDATNTDSQQNDTANAGRFYAEFSRQDWATHWYEVATQLCRIHDGLSARVDRHRAKRLKALGNAIVPQVAYEIFKAINQLNNEPCPE